MRLLVISSLTLFFSIARCQPIWDDKLDHEAIEFRLRNEAVIEQISLFDYFKKRTKVVQASHPIKVITLENGLKGVFKVGEYHYAEVAAYRASKALGLRLVPPTVFKTVDGVQGSLQFLVEDACHCSLKKLDPKTLSDMRLFYYIVGQWDTHRQNQVITKSKNDYHLALIDNSAILHRSYSIYGGPLFIEKGSNKTAPSDQSYEFPFHKAQKIKGSDIFSVFKPYLSQAHIKALSRHNSLNYILWKGTLWLEKNSVNRHAKKYAASTLEALKNLTEDELRIIWAEWYQIEPEHAEEVIQLTLKRRDEVLKGCSTKEAHGCASLDWRYAW